MHTGAGSVARIGSPGAPGPLASCISASWRDNRKPCRAAHQGSICSATRSDSNAAHCQGCRAPPCRWRQSCSGRTRTAIVTRGASVEVARRGDSRGSAAVAAALGIGPRAHRRRGACVHRHVDAIALDDVDELIGRRVAVDAHGGRDDAILLEDGPGSRGCGCGCGYIDVARGGAVRGDGVVMRGNAAGWGLPDGQAECQQGAGLFT